MRLPVAALLCCLCMRPLWSMEPPVRLMDFDIRAQPLSGALLQFSSQSGIQVLAGDTRLADRQVRGLRGRMTATTALGRLLAGSGFSFRQVDAGTIALVRGEAADSSLARPPPPAPSVSGLDAAAIPAATEELDEVEEVQVTGTRIRARGTYTAIAPMTTVTAEEMRRLGIVNV